MGSKAWKQIKEWAIVISIGFLLAFIIQKTAFALYIVEGKSMLPTLKENERVFVNRLPIYFNQLERGDIVVFPNPVDGRNFVKRVIGLPGDVIEIRDGQVILNGNVLHEPYVDTITLGELPPTTVKENHVFVMGDNRHPNASWDSRDETIGQIPMDQIAGEAEFVLFPVPHGLK
jgi:signal peptidase I